MYIYIYICIYIYVYIYTYIYIYIHTYILEIAKEIRMHPYLECFLLRKKYYNHTNISFGSETMIAIALRFLAAVSFGGNDSEP